MADYYPVLSRALSNLGDSASPDVRKVIYERARSALVMQLQDAEPPLPPEHIERERASLEAVIARLEVEARERSKAASQPSRRFRKEQADADDGPAASRAPDDEEATPEALEPPGIAAGNDDAGARKRQKPARGSSAEAGRKRGFGKFNWIAAVLGVLVVAAVGTLGGLAYVLRDHIDPSRRELAEQEASQPTPKPAPDAKIGARLGTSGDNPGSPTPAPTSAPPAAPPDQAQQLPVSQRATLFLEVPGAAGQVPRTVAGRVVWHFENLPGRPGQPLDPALVGLVEVPDAGITLRLQITRNHDNLLPASYLVGLVFTTKDMTVKEVAPLLLKASESERGAPLVGIEQPLGENLFVMALSADDSDVSKNFDLLTKRGWIEVQFRLADQRRGAIVFEKGISGDRALLAAIDAWK